MDLETFFQLLLNGTAIGLLYALTALGISLMWNASQLFNFAQGEFLALGAYFMLTIFSVWHFPYVIAALLTLGLMGLIGYFASVTYFNPLFENNIDPHMVLITTVAISIFLQNLILLVWGPDAKAYKNIFGSEPIEIAGIHIMPHVIWILLIVAIFLILLQLFMKKTKVGIGMRAVAQNPKAAQLMGIRVSHMIAITLMISSILAGVAGILIAPIFPLTPFMGVSVVILSFASLLIGGLGSFVGPLIGGLLVGISSTFFATLFSSSYKLVFVFIFMTIILLIKPGGIFKAKISEKA